MVASFRKLRGYSTIGAAMASAAILWGLPSANASSGGGCLKSSAQGFTIESCISGHNFTAIPDYYIDSVPDLKGQPCSIQPFLFVNRGVLGIIQETPQACVPGHVFLTDYKLNQPGNYYLEVRVIIGNNNRLILKADSPIPP